VTLLKETADRQRTELFTLRCTPRSLTSRHHRGWQSEFDWWLARSHSKTIVPARCSYSDIYRQRVALHCNLMIDIHFVKHHRPVHMPPSYRGAQLHPAASIHPPAGLRLRHSKARRLEQYYFCVINNDDSTRANCHLPSTRQHLICADCLEVRREK